MSADCGATKGAADRHLWDASATMGMDPGDCMRLNTVAEIRAYVTRELHQVAESCPSWGVDGPTGSSDEKLSWKLQFKGGSLSLWYNIEVRLDNQEFLIWFGNYQVGIEQIHWIMRPAVHVAFADLGQSLIPVTNYSLGDILRAMIRSLENPGGLEDLRFQPNTFSFT